MNWWADVKVKDDDNHTLNLKMSDLLLIDRILIELSVGRSNSNDKRSKMVKKSYRCNMYDTISNIILSPALRRASERSILKLIVWECPM